MFHNRFETYNYVDNFKTFYRGWLIRQENYYHELLQNCTQDDDDEKEEKELKLKKLIDRVIVHYIHYFNEKSKLTRENVFLVLSPTWFTSFERTFSWIAGFKPELPCQLVIHTVSDLSEEQLGRMGQLIKETRIEEKELAEVVSTVQGNLATAMVAEAARSTVNGEVSDVELAIERLRTAMKELVECADYLRGKTVMKIVKILRPTQTVKFLAAFAQFQLRIRTWGIHEDKDEAT